MNIKKIYDWSDKHFISVLIICGIITPIILTIHAILTGKGELTLEGLYKITIKEYWEALTT